MRAFGRAAGRRLAWFVRQLLIANIAEFGQTVTTESNPFRVGDWVCYTPTSRGHALGVNTDLSVLVPGQRYRIASIEGPNYIVLAGFENSPSGGLWWTEFSVAK